LRILGDILGLFSYYPLGILRDILGLFFSLYPLRILGDILLNLFVESFEDPWSYPWTLFFVVSF